MEEDQGRMVKLQRNGWLSALLLGMCFFMSSGVLADNTRLTSSNKFLQCQTSLKRFCRHLEECAKTRNEVYYENLYNQARDLLRTLESLPTSSTADLDKCENYLKVIQDIVGTHHSGSDLGSMPSDSNPSSGKLTKGAAELRRRPFSKHAHVRYVCEDAAVRKRVDNDDDNEESKELDDFALSSRPTPSTSRMKRERKDLE